MHEVHPMLAHFPLALLPIAFAADLAGRLTGRSGWMQIGRQLMPVAAISGAATAVAGLAAQEGVEVGDAHDILVTHRNLNAGLIGLVGVLAFIRMHKTKPGTGYLLASAGALSGMVYTAYLGGKMVYDHGVGVASASGVQEQGSPALRYGELQEAGRIAADNISHATGHAIKHIREGNIAPALHR
jgi:uncharacterized membrane protein